MQTFPKPHAAAVVVVSVAADRKRGSGVLVMEISLPQQNGSIELMQPGRQPAALTNPA
jgi:hypothetical protein